MLSISTVCFIRPEPAAFFLAHRLHQMGGLKAIVVEESPPLPRWQRLRYKWQKEGWPGLWMSLRLRLKAQRGQERTEQMYQVVFGESWRDLPDQVPVLRVRSINEARVGAWLDRFQPDWVVVHGTTIIRAEILDKPSLFLNIHWGLSPWYRGVRCTEWALLNEDIRGIGVTLHRLSKRIDGGDILAQSEIDLEPHDHPHRMDMKLTRKGVALLEEIKFQVEQGQKLHFMPQDLSQGKLYTTRMWSYRQHQQIRSLLKAGKLTSWLASKDQRASYPLTSSGTGGASPY
ncbi:MAG: formyl transferase [Bacteroidota bacterium]